MWRCAVVGKVCESGAESGGERSVLGVVSTGGGCVVPWHEGVSVGETLTQEGSPYKDLPRTQTANSPCRPNTEQVKRTAKRSEAEAFNRALLRTSGLGVGR